LQGVTPFLKDDLGKCVTHLFTETKDDDNSDNEDDISDEEEIIRNDGEDEESTPKKDGKLNKLSLINVVEEGKRELMKMDLVRIRDKVQNRQVRFTNIQDKVFISVSNNDDTESKKVDVLLMHDNDETSVPMFRTKYILMSD